MIARRILAAVILLCMIAPAHAQKTKAQINSEIGTLFPDNGQGLITPQGLRTVTQDIVSSYVDWLTCTGSGGVVFWSSGAPTCLTAGTAGQILQTNGAGPPSWVDTPFRIKSPQDFGAVCNGVTDDAVALQAWLNSLRDGGVGSFTAAQSASGCATSAPLLLQASTNIAPVQGPRFIGTIHLKGILGLGASATGTSSGTNLTLSSVVGSVHAGDTVIGGGTPNNTHIVSQSSGPTGGNGIYVTDFAAGVSGASLAITSDVLRIWNPTAISTSQNFYYPVFDSLLLAAASPAVANCLSLRGYWGSITSVLSRDGCRNGDLVQFPNYIGPGSIPDEYESTPSLGTLTCIGCGGYVVNNLIGIGASPRIGGIRGTVQGGFTTGQGAIFASGDENVQGAVAYTGLGWAITVNQPPAGGGAIVTTPHEVFIGPGAGDIDCAQNGIKIAALEFGSISGHRINIEPAGGICGATQWPVTAWSFGGGGGVVNGVKAFPYISIRGSVNLASSTLFDFNSDASITNLVVDSVISDQTGTLAAASFSTLYKNINAAATIKIIQNGVVFYDTTTQTTFANLRPCVAGMQGVRMAVTDSTTAVFNANIAGSGANKVGAYCNGTNWVVG